MTETGVEGPKQQKRPPVLPTRYPFVLEHRRGKAPICNPLFVVYPNPTVRRFLVPRKTRDPRKMRHPQTSTGQGETEKHQASDNGE
jgi:hypothetical protein